MKCLECGCAMMADQSRRKLPLRERRQVRSHRGRGLCSRCYSIALKADALLDHETLRYQSDVLLEEAFILATERGLRYRDLPAALNLTRGSLTRAVRRGLLLGDERAAHLTSLNTYPTKGAP